MIDYSCNPDMPDWVLKHVLKMTGSDNTIVNARSHYRSGHYRTFAALCNTILAYEKPPVDPDLLIAREACAQYAVGHDWSGAAEGYRNGEYDFHPAINKCRIAVKLAREGVPNE